MNKKKIMIIHHSGSIGGAGVSVFNTIEALKNEYEIVIYCPSQPKDFSSFLKNNGVVVKTFDFPIGSIHHYSGGSSLFSLGFAKGITNIYAHKEKWKKIFDIENPDLIIANSKILAWVSLITKNTSFKSICYVRETRKKSTFNVWNNIQKRLLEKFDGVIFISKYDKKQESLKNSNSVIPNFIDMKNYKESLSRKEICERLNLNPKDFNILFVGGMLKIKGFDIAVESMKYLKNTNAKLIVAGDSKFIYRPNTNILNKIYNFLKKKHENKIERIIKENNLEKNIEKIGIQNRMNDIYSLADVLIFPATTPHQARPVFEAGATATPVIMPDFENTLEYVSNDINGLIFKNKNSKDLADKIQTIINDKEFAQKLGQKNYEYTLKNHTRVTSEKSLKLFISEILNH